jgi:antibiotic biosynthesis monooxygenase (ABM) superfamily enzyme
MGQQSWFQASQRPPPWRNPICSVLYSVFELVTLALLTLGALALGVLSMVTLLALYTIVMGPI